MFILLSTTTRAGVIPSDLFRHASMIVLFFNTLQNKIAGQAGNDVRSFIDTDSRVCTSPPAPTAA